MLIAAALSGVCFIAFALGYSAGHLDGHTVGYSDGYYDAEGDLLDHQDAGENTLP